MTGGSAAGGSVTVGSAGQPSAGAGSAYTQMGFAIRFDWGLQGAWAISADAEIVVVVDVLSFSTAVSVAVEGGIEVFPYRFRDATAAAYAARRQAVLAIGRSEAGESGVSLSPASIRAALEPGGTLVDRSALILPSPNGATICRELAEQGKTVVAACLRNCGSVALWVQRAAGSGPIAVVAAGERWPGDALRPAVEDLWGAGAVLSAVSGRLSPEAQSAVAAYRSASRSLPDSLAACASGRELIDDGYPDDVTIAAESGSSVVVPVLRGESFTPAT